MFTCMALQQVVANITSMQPCHAFPVSPAHRVAVNRRVPQCAVQRELPAIVSLVAQPFREWTSLQQVEAISDLGAQDPGRMAVSGSQGGLCSAQYALAVRPLLSVFSDVGMGMLAAGMAGWHKLQKHALGACTVSHANTGTPTQRRAL